MTVTCLIALAAVKLVQHSC